MVDKISAYQTSDGSIFGTEKEAKAHEAFLELRCSFGQTSIYSQMDFNQAMDWLRVNKNLVSDWLAGLEE